MLDWDELRSFMAIARCGSLSGAARAMKVHQPTMGRRLRALEARVGVRLFQKTPTGFVITAAGAAVLRHVEQMEVEALAAERALTGIDARLEGDVRLTTFEPLVPILRPILAAFNERYQGIALEVTTDVRSFSLTKREADVALRLARPTQSELTVRKVADVACAIYASPSYLERHGAPDFAAGAPGHFVVLPDEDVMTGPEMTWFSALTARARTVLRSNSHYLRRDAAAIGMGLVCQSRCFGDAEPRLACLAIPPARPAPLRELWLAVHSDMRLTPRIKALTQFLAAELGERRALLSPPP